MFFKKGNISSKHRHTESAFTYPCDPAPKSILRQMGKLMIVVADKLLPESNGL